jgi:hypothetical protein
MKDKTPSFVADSGTVSSGGLHPCQVVGCAVGHASTAAPHVSHMVHFLTWLFG